jgi:hypothetical protein
MRKQLIEMARMLKNLCKDKEEYIELCEKYGVNKNHRFIKELYGE